MGLSIFIKTSVILDIRPLAFWSQHCIQKPLRIPTLPDTDNPPPFLSPSSFGSASHLVDERDNALDSSIAAVGHHPLFHLHSCSSLSVCRVLRDIAQGHYQKSQVVLKGRSGHLCALLVLEAHNSVVQLISLCYFQDIFSYELIFVWFLFIGSVVDLNFTVATLRVCCVTLRYEI